MKGLNSNKSPDINGITAEHYKLACSSVVPVLTTLVNRSFASHYPSQCNLGVKTPVLKKGKDPSDMDSYRGIDVSALFGKVLDKAALSLIHDDLAFAQDPLQFGFTQKSSPYYVSLIITEYIAEKSSKVCSFII